MGELHTKRTKIEEDQESWRHETEPAMESLDVPGLRRLTANLEKSMRRNQELRAKYPDDPMKFMNSEIDLDESIKKMSAILGTPRLYVQLKEFHVTEMMVHLLVHENTDIALSVVKLIEDMSDADTIREESMEEYDDEQVKQVFYQWIIEEGLLEALIQNLERLDEFSQEEDRTGVFQILSILENLIELEPLWAEIICTKVATILIPWLLHRQSPEFSMDSNKQYASEITAILLQTSSSNRLLFGSSDYGGINALLVFLAHYIDRDPENKDEVELMENWFDVLCSCLLERELKRVFQEAEGMELMILMVQKKRLSRRGALKTLTHALMNSADLGLADHFIECLGLKILFQVFMKRSVKNARKKMYKGYHEQEEDEFIMSILYALFKYTQEKTCRTRLLHKFIEQDSEKVHQLVDYHVRYVEHVIAIEQQLEKEHMLRKDHQDDDDSSDQMSTLTDEEMYLRQLESGGTLFTLQMIDAIIGCLIHFADNDDQKTLLSRKLRHAFSQKESSLDKVTFVLRVYADHIDDEHPNDTHHIENKERTFLYSLAKTVQQITT
jgi:beta-catenin-like protein 1